MGLCRVYVLLAMAGIACGLSLDQLSLGLIAKTNDVHEYRTPITGRSIALVSMKMYTGTKIKFLR